MNRMENFTASQRSAMQGFSRRLFGNRHRLEVALAILDLQERAPHDLYKQAIARATGLTDAEVEKHLRAFRTTGMLERHPNPPLPPKKRGRGKPPHVLRTSSDQLWSCLGELGERFRS